MKQALGDADFYFSTWHSDYNDTLLATFEEHGFNLVGYEFISEPEQLENERNILTDFTDSFPDFFILNQWYGVKRAIQLMQDCSVALQKHYDLVVRCRFDLDCSFTLEELHNATQQDAMNYVKALSGGSDQFIFGSPDTMAHFLTLEDWLLNFSRKFGNSHGFFASPLIRAFFLDQGIPTNRVDLKVNVARQDRTSASAAREQRTRDYIAKHFPEFEGKAWHGPRNVDHVVRPAPWDLNFGNNRSLVYINGKRG
ncbi:hypothetical protein [Pseudomonas cremoricolorata]|uniref:hypothetical protein n=1 Tax=Pseudomonas cremoricolorata TaxID=157783 RepID=UPI0004154B87|nr:hypothetical protein [Pseudomonas cremoricolorata]